MNCRRRCDPKPRQYSISLVRSCSERSVGKLKLGFFPEVAMPLRLTPPGGRGRGKNAEENDNNLSKTYVIKNFD